MVAMTFDTHKFVKELESVNFSEKQAETVVKVLSQAQEQSVTKEHFDHETKLTCWMIGALFAVSITTMTLVFKIVISLPKVG